MGFNARCLRKFVPHFYVVECNCITSSYIMLHVTCCFWVDNKILFFFTQYERIVFGFNPPEFSCSWILLSVDSKIQNGNPILFPIAKRSTHCGVPNQILPWKLTWNQQIKVWFRWFSFFMEWFSGSFRRLRISTRQVEQIRWTCSCIARESGFPLAPT